MKMVVFGATGRTGRAVVDEAIRRGWDVVAAARTAEDTSWPEGVAATSVDVRDAGAVAAVLADADAAVFAVGIGASRRPTRVYSDGVANVLAATVSSRASKLSVISAAPVAPAEVLPGGQRVVSKILSLFFGTTYADMRRMEATLDAADSQWVCLRPPRLVDKPARRAYRLTSRPTGSSITHADLASALIDVLDDRSAYRRHIFVAN